jgi:hypothetical protein
MCTKYYTVFIGIYMTTEYSVLQHELTGKFNVFGNYDVY